jgi:ABC-type antimicrobial peptide transport system permease subunit
MTARSRARRHTSSLTLGAFLSVAVVVLGAVGIAGVLSFEVSERSSEIGLQKALGAPPDQVYRLFLGKGL